MNDFHPDALGRRGRVLIRKKPYTEVGATMLQLDAKTVAAVRDYLIARPHYRENGAEPLLLNKNRIGFSENGFGSWIRRIAQHIAAETGIPWTTEDMRFTANEEKRALIHDPDLRDKCTAALEAPEGEADLEDAVLGASKILELRVREACNPPRDRRSGVQLMLFAFAEPNPALRLSSDDREQNGFKRMYAGLMGVYRNRAFHEARGDLDQRTARQIVLWIDHLLTLLEEASPAQRLVVTERVQ